MAIRRHIPSLALGTSPMGEVPSASEAERLVTHVRGWRLGG